MRILKFLLIMAVIRLLVPAVVEAKNKGTLTQQYNYCTSLHRKITKRQACYEDLINTYPEYSGGYLGLAYVFKMQNNLNKAVDYFHIALTKIIDATTNDTLTKCDALYGMAVTYFALESLDKAEENFGEAQKTCVKTNRNYTLAINDYLEQIRDKKVDLCEIQFMAEPATGAAVKINGEFVGKTPLKYSVECKEGEFIRGNEIVAMPTRYGCNQVEIFSARDKVPKKMLFIMDLCVQPKSLDINLNE